MSSKNIYIPYFYIIRHIPSNKMYAGSRYGKNCHPDELLKQNGYITSSETIKKLIHDHGLNSFEILRIDTNCDGMHPYDYETIFLEANNCAKSNIWINMHNNTIPPTYGTKEFKQLMINKYGVEYYSQLPEFNQKAKTTYLKKYGNEHYRNTEKSIQTNMDRYGVTNSFDIIEIKEQYIRNNLERYGVEYPIQNKEIQQRCKNTYFKRTGYDNPLLNPEVKDIIKKKHIERYGVEFYNNPQKTKETNLERYGVENVFANTDIQLQIKETNINKFGTEFPMQNPEVIQRWKDNYFKKTGYTSSNHNPEVKKKLSDAAKNLPVKKCPHCGFESISNGIYKNHFDNCKQNPSYEPKLIICPHCNKESIGGQSAMNRWHFDNCKSKN